MDRLRIVGFVCGAVLVVVCAVDIAGGSYVNQTGTVSGHNWHMTMECTARDNKGNCTAYMPVDHYQLVISHQAEVTVAEVWLGQYYKYSNGDQVQIAFWRGGLVGVKWFVVVSDREADF